MNSYFNTFQNITQSVELLLKDEQNSLEIKQSAISLAESIRPCIEELKQSAIKLKQLILVCSDKLHHAENVWLCKPKIAEAEKHELWEQLGEISGRSIRIRKLGNKCKDEAVIKAKQSWEIHIERLKCKWFIDAKGQTKKGIGWDDKKGFINEITPIIDILYKSVNEILKVSLNLIYKELINLELESNHYYLSLLEKQKKYEISEEISLIRCELKNKFSNPIAYLPNYTLSLKTTVSSDLKALIDRGWGDISWEDVVKFKDKVASKIDGFIIAIFEDRVKLASEALAKMLAFYNDFLEQQERYQQETPEQREAEKAWLEERRQELTHLQASLEAIFIEDKA